MHSKTLSPPMSLGFRNGTSGVHTSRTMMLDELSTVLDKVGSQAKRDAYLSAILDENVLAKPTQATRQKTAKHLTAVYALDPDCTVFRLLRHFWSADPAGRPMLAFLAATTRDSLLRGMTTYMIEAPLGSDISAPQISSKLSEMFPGRFSQTTLISTAQNLASSWTQAGFLTGKMKKRRSSPTITPVLAGFAVLLGYLCGIRGKQLLDSQWTRLLDCPHGKFTEYVMEASSQGWLTYKAAGGVIEITFPGLLKPHEERAAYEPD